MTATRVSPFGAQLRELREAGGLSQEDLAERAGLAAKAIGALERGERRRPYPRTVQMLADALRLDDAARRQLIAAVPRASRPSRTEAELFVGRDQELAELLAKLRGAAGGHGGIAMIVGEAGVGKTRLAQEFMIAARGQGAVTLSGRALEGEGQAPFGPWVEAIERYAFDRDPSALRRDLGFDAPSIAQLVPLVRSRLTDIPRPDALGPSDERLRLYGAVTRFCSAIASEGTVLVFLDDLHWADRDTLGLMRYLAGTLSQSRVLIVGAYRDPELGVDATHPLMAALASLRHDIACPTIRLRGLDRATLDAYLSHEAGHALSKAFVERVDRETGGNPFYAREVLRHIAENEAHGGGDRALEMAGVPEGVRQVVADRVRRLSPPTAQALRDACGFTGGFTFAVLQQLTQLSEGELLDCLDESAEAGLLRAPPADAREYEFAHAIVRHALYEGQSRDRRIRLHRRIASALEAAYPGQELEHAAELTVQYHASAELAGAGKGLRYALAAADQARSAFAHDRVVTLLRMACDLAGEANADARIEILTRLALAEAETVRSPDACRSADRALELMASAGATERVRAEFLASVARALKHSGADAQLWGPLIDRGIEMLHGERDVLWARLTLLRDHVDGVRSGPVGVALWSGPDREAVALARASDSETDYASTLEALDWRERAETDAINARIHTWSQPRAVLHGLEVVLRDLVYKHGDFRAARSAAEELLALALRVGSVSAEAEARAQIATCTLGLGDLASARARMAEAEQAVARLGPSHRLHLVPIGFAVALGYFLETDWAAIARTAEAFARAADTHRTTVGLGAAGYATVAFVRAERLADARAWLREIAAASEHAHARAYIQGWALMASAVAVWEAGFVELANGYQRLLLDLAEVGAGRCTFGSVDLALARMAALAGAHDDAREFFARAARQAEDAGHRPLQAIIAYDEALAATRSGATDERMRAFLDRAIGTFDATGMRSWSDRARSLQASPRPRPSPRAAPPLQAGR